MQELARKCSSNLSLFYLLFLSSCFHFFFFTFSFFPPFPGSLERDFLVWMNFHRLSRAAFKISSISFLPGPQGRWPTCTDPSLKTLRSSSATKPMESGGKAGEGSECVSTAECDSWMFLWAGSHSTSPMWAPFPFLRCVTQAAGMSAELLQLPLCTP